MVRVLVVEDDEATRETLRFMLEDAGYTVAEAEDGEQALEALRASETPLVTLLDLDLPVLDGAEVLDEVAREPALAQRHAYVLVTAVDPVRRASATAIALREHLDVPLVTKPFDVDELLDIITQAACKLPAS